MDNIYEKMEDVKGEDYAEDLKDKFNEFLDSVSDKAEDIKDDVSDFVDQKHSKAKESKKGFKTAAG